MRTGSSSTFVIAWTQVEVEGLTRAPLTALTVGAHWRWTGGAVCVDGSRNVLVLDGAIGQAELHNRAAHSVRRMIGSAMADAPIEYEQQTRERLFSGGFDVTDGTKRYEITVIDTPDLGSPLLMFVGDVPPVNQNLWVVSSYVAGMSEQQDSTQGAVICFTPGTQILTPHGVRNVEDLREGDMVETKDNGAQALRWMGRRKLSGARLYAMPQLRPIRFRANALGMGEPDQDLLVSPYHRMLVAGQAARELFNADEVLVSAKDLVNDRSIVVDRAQRSLEYIHLMFDAHQVIVANGLETESFHPDVADLDNIAGDQKARLLERFPHLTEPQGTYGPAARRALSAAEAAILAHEVA